MPINGRSVQVEDHSGHSTVGGLEMDLMRRCSELKIEFKVWGEGHKQQGSNSSPLLLVSAEQASTTDFLAHITTQSHQRLLDKIMLDEAHLLLTASDYRLKLEDLRTLRKIKCPFVALSATLPLSTDVVLIIDLCYI